MIAAVIVFLNVALKYIMIDTRKENEFIYYAILGIISLLCLIAIFIDVNYLKCTKLKNMSILALPIIVIVLTVLIFSRDTNFILPFMFALAFINIDYNKIIKYFFVSSIICFTVHIFLFILGILKDQSIMYRIAKDGSIINRNYLGFTHPNNSFMFLLPIILSGYCLVKTFSQKLVFISIAFFVSFIIFIETDSRTGFVCIILILIISLINEKWIERRKILITIGRFMFFILSFVSIGIAILCGNDVLNPVNLLLSGRPYIWNMYLKNGLSLVPTSGEIQLQESQILPQYGQSIDNYYIFFLLRYGIILFLVMGILYYIFLKNLQNSGHIKLYIATIFYLIYGMAETNTILVGINFTLIFIYSVYFNKYYFKKKCLDKTQINLNNNLNFNNKI